MSTTAFQQIAAAANWNFRVNENFDSCSPAGLYGRNPATTTGLTWGYLGGNFNGVSVANGTVSLTASTTNYVVAHRTTGAVTVSTSTTNWNDTATYLRLFQVVTGTSTVTSYDDKRQAYGAGGSGGAAEDISYDNSTSGLSATDVRAAIDEVAGVIVSAAKQCIPVACSDETTALTAGTAKVTFHMPYDFTLTGVMAGLTTAQTSGSILTVDINLAGSSILSTKLTIDNTEDTSLTAATPAVISTSALTQGQKVTIDIDQVGDGTAKGLKVYLIGTV